MPSSWIIEKIRHTEVSTGACEQLCEGWGREASPFCRLPRPPWLCSHRIGYKTPLPRATGSGGSEVGKQIGKAERRIRTGTSP